MGGLLAFSRAVDKLNTMVGKLADLAVITACFISAGNAFVRYGISSSSNGWLEVQWYLFGATVLLGASYTLLRNEHVRVDLVYGNLGERARLWVDVFGFILFMLPAMLLLTWMTFPFFLDAFVRNEVSANPGGLIRWPVKALMPVGFFLLSLQGFSELIKRVALLMGIKPEGEVVVEYHRPEQ